MAHTHEVGARLYNLQADIRDVESAALTLSKGIDTPALRERMHQADQIHANVDELARLVSDNQEQLLRMGRMDSLLERRMSLAKQVAGSAASDPQQQRQLIEEMTFHFPIRGIVRELQGHEESVLAERVGVTLPTLRKLEAGDPSASLATVVRVLQALGLAQDIDKLAAQDEWGRELQDSELKQSRRSAPGKAAKPPSETQT